MKNRQDLTRNILLAVASVVVLAVGAEFALRVVSAAVRPRFTKIDSQVGWYHYPGATADREFEGHRYRLTYNSHGYRGPDYTYEKSEGMVRVVLLGDSFLDGSEVGDDEVSTALLAARFPCVEFVNLGVYGYSTAQQLVTLEHVGFQYDPDLVVVLSFTNDFAENLRNVSFFGPAPRYVMQGDSLRFEGTESDPAKETFRSTNLPFVGRSLLHRHSHLYYVLNRLVYQRLAGADIGAIVSEQERQLNAHEQRELYRRLIAKMRRQTAERGVDFVVAFGYEQDELQVGGVSRHADLMQQLTADSVRVLDLFEDLSRGDAMVPGGLYYVGDIHWNPRGHKTVADRVSRWMNGWLLQRSGEICGDQIGESGT